MFQAIVRLYKIASTILMGQTIDIQRMFGKVYFTLIGDTCREKSDGIIESHLHSYRTLVFGVLIWFIACQVLIIIPWFSEEHDAATTVAIPKFEFEYGKLDTLAELASQGKYWLCLCVGGGLHSH